MCLADDRPFSVWSSSIVWSPSLVRACLWLNALLVFGSERGIGGDLMRVKTGKIHSGRATAAPPVRHATAKGMLSRGL